MAAAKKSAAKKSAAKTTATRGTNRTPPKRAKAGARAGTEARALMRGTRQIALSDFGLAKDVAGTWRSPTPASSSARRST